jgi:hypothetical protein
MRPNAFINSIYAGSYNGIGFIFETKPPYDCFPFINMDSLILAGTP